MDRKRKIYYIITSIFGVIISVTVLWRRTLPQVGSISYSQAFCDAFFSSGIILIGIWLIALTWYHGGLDLFLYAGALMFSLSHRENKDRERLDYVTWREEKKLVRREPIHLFHVACVFLGIAIVLYIILKVIA